MGSEGGVPPFASVVVPTRNEEQTIERCLASIVGQDYPAGRLEVLVVDGGSTDGTRSLVERAAEESAVPIRLLENPGRVVPAALNVALAAAEGEFLVRVDGHSVPARDYVRRCVQGNVEHDAALSGGWVRAVGNGPVSRAVAAAFASPFSMGNAASWNAPSAPRDVASVPCGSYRVDALRAIGGFDEGQHANQDYEANYRLRRAGERIVLLPEVWFDYIPRSTFRALARQFARYGYFKARTMAKHPASVRLRHLVPAAGLLGLAALAIAAVFGDPARVALLVAAGLYAVGLVVAAVSAGRRVDFPARLLLPAVFATMHLAWGAGNVAGLARFVPLRKSLRS